MTFRELAGTLLAEAQRLPAMPPMPIDYSSLLAGVRQWVAELDGAQSDVASAQQASAASASDGAAQLAAADEGADAEGWHRLQWLMQVLAAHAAALMPGSPSSCLPRSASRPTCPVCTF